MQTFVLNPSSGQLPIGGLVDQVGTNGVEVRNDAGEVIAYVLPPAMKEALTYMEARRELEAHAEEVRAAVGRRGGRTMSEILAELHQRETNAPGAGT
jgi:hypothetical protein